MTNATITTPAEREIQVERVFDAPLARVWSAFTEPELLARWWGRGNKLEIVRWRSSAAGTGASSSTDRTATTGSRAATAR